MRALTHRDQCADQYSVSMYPIWYFPIWYSRHRVSSRAGYLNWSAHWSLSGCVPPPPLTSRSRAQEHGSELATTTAELLKKVEVVRKQREEGENYKRAPLPLTEEPALNQGAGNSVHTDLHIQGVSIWGFTGRRQLSPPPPPWFMGCCFLPRRKRSEI